MQSGMWQRNAISLCCFGIEGEDIRRLKSVVSLPATAGIEISEAHEHSEQLTHGKYLVFLNGTVEEIERAEKSLHTEPRHLE